MKSSTTSCLHCVLLALPLIVTACAPKIYVIDRQTVLEEQAAGEWPQFEKEVLEKSKAKGPAPLSKVPTNARRARLYSVLNGEMTMAPKEAQKIEQKPDAKSPTKAGARK